MAVTARERMAGMAKLICSGGMRSRMRSFGPALRWQRSSPLTLYR